MSDLILSFARSSTPIDVYSKGFIFSICYIPSVDYTASASEVGTPDRMTTMMRWHRMPDWWASPYALLTYCHRETRIPYLPYIESTDVVPLHPGHIGSRPELPMIIPILVNSLLSRRAKLLVLKDRFGCVPFTLDVMVVPRLLRADLCISLLIATLVNFEKHRRVD